MSKRTISLKYAAGLLLTAPLLPLLYIQGRRLKNTMLDLPEANDTVGASGLHSNPPAKMLVIGESTMAGVGVESNAEGFVGTLANHLSEHFNRRIHWQVYAKSGITANRVSKELLAKIEESDWDLIVIGLGGNDAFQANSPNHWKYHVRLVISELQHRFPTIPIVFTNMPPVKEFPAFTSLMKSTIGNLIELLGQALQEVVKEFENVYYASDVIQIDDWVNKHNLSSDRSLYFSDGVHPSKLAYQLLAKDVSWFIIKKEYILT